MVQWHIHVVKIMKTLQEMQTLGAQIWRFLDRNSHDTIEEMDT